MENIEIEFKKDKGPGLEVQRRLGKIEREGNRLEAIRFRSSRTRTTASFFENQYVRVLDVVVGPGEDDAISQAFDRQCPDYS